jgi:hypothetical protein
MAPEQRIKLNGGRQRKICVFVNSERDFARVQILDYLIRLDMLPPPCRRKPAWHDIWLGLVLFLPSYLFLVWKLFTA